MEAAMAASSSSHAHGGSMQGGAPTSLPRPHIEPSATAPPSGGGVIKRSSCRRRRAKTSAERRKVTFAVSAFSAIGRTAGLDFRSVSGLAWRADEIVSRTLPSPN